METFQNFLATFTVKKDFFSAVGDVSVCLQRAPRNHPVSKRSQAVRLPKQPPPAVPKGVDALRTAHAQHR